MKILFLHSRCPGQFMQLASMLSQNDDNEVVFIAQHQRQDINLPKVRIIKANKKNLDEVTHSSEKALLSQFHTGESFGATLLKLRQDGFYPDVVYDHPGWGCSAYVPDIFPQAARVSYFEWFYTKNADYEFFNQGKERPPASFASNRMRNLFQLDALRECDVAISPTSWQMHQYPLEYLYKFRVIHDGVDMDFFSPDPGSEKEDLPILIQGLDVSSMPEIVTYATRGMEPYRGFPQFFHSIPHILAARPQCHIVIMANDDVVYGAKRPDGKTWGEALREEVAFDPKRVHFLKFGSYPEYRNLLRLSSVHVYLTVPFVLSWSMLEAMSCGCLVVGSATPPVQEVITHTQNGFLTSFWDSLELAKTIIRVLDKKESLQEVRHNARKTIDERYNLKKMFAQQMLLIQQTILHKKLIGQHD